MLRTIKLFILSALTVIGLSAAPVYAASSSSCGGTKTQLIACDSSSGVGAIGDLIKIAIMVLTILIGTVAVGGIVYAAILYASARDDQSQVSSAIVIIRNIVIGLLLYGFTIAIINWLVPGGVIG